MSDQVDALPDCEHHWVSRHQPDFPEPIYWIDTCSLCERISGERLAEEIAPLRAENETLRGIVSGEGALRALTDEAVPE